MDGGCLFALLLSRKSPGNLGACNVKCSQTSGGEKVNDIKEKVVVDTAILIVPAPPLTALFQLREEEVDCQATGGVNVDEIDRHF